MNLLTELQASIAAWLDGAGVDLFSFFTLVIRFLLPLIAIIVILRCVRSLLAERYEGEEWGYLSLPNGSRIPLNHWENIIGRSRASDVCLQYPTMSRSHAAVIRNDKGDWSVYDLESRGGVLLNGRRVERTAPLKSGDVIALGGVELVFVPMTKEHEVMQAEMRREPGWVIRPAATLWFVTMFQLLLTFQFCMAEAADFDIRVPIAFLGLIALMWLSYILTRAMRRVAFEIETLAFLLCSIGMAVCASSSPGSVYKQLALLTMSVAVYFVAGWFLRDLDRAKKSRWPVAAAGLLLLGVNLVLSEVVFGARNWLTIAGVTFQPSEFVKVAFVIAGAATLDRLFARRNLLLFIGFAGACVGALALMSDFGTALVFFAAYLVIAFIRSGNLATVFLSVAGAGFAGFIAVTLKSHIAARFATWGHAWEMANDGGYQQTRTMAAAASGGLFGTGAGTGWLKDIFAADTDLVFGMVCEELGLILAVLAILVLVIYAAFSMKAAAKARSSFYVIGACAAVTIMLTQTILNVLGSVDVLPLTGVTFPFVSRGGSSLISCWALLAFIKAVDTRQNASFTVKAPKLTEPDPVLSFSEMAEREGGYPQPTSQPRTESPERAVRRDPAPRPRPYDQDAAKARRPYDQDVGRAPQSPPEADPPEAELTLPEEDGTRVYTPRDKNARSGAEDFQVKIDYDDDLDSFEISDEYFKKPGGDDR